MTIRTYQAFAITLCVLVGAFVWATFYPDAPYEILAAAVVAVFGGYGYKRLAQRRSAYNPGNNVGGEEPGVGHE